MMTITLTEIKYRKNVGKLFYNTLRKRLVLVEGIKKADYKNMYNYSLLYLDDTKSGINFPKKIAAIDFCREIGKRFIEIKDPQQYNKLLDDNPNSILR